ncbi:MAG: zf-TFIIB domain-containing protein [bacterium]
MRLVACPQCHAQYDVATVNAPEILCRCGAQVPTAARPGVDLPVQRCSSCGAVAREGARSCEYCGAEIAWSGGPGDLVCPECFARNADDARFCVACGVKFAPQPTMQTCETVQCVRCALPMPGRSIGDVLVHECPRCNSLWVPGDHLDALVQKAAAGPRGTSPEAKPGDASSGTASGAPPGTANPGAAKPGATAPRVRGGNPLAESVEYRRCPSCGQLMNRANFRRISGVVIDRCPDHGTWLDADELEEIAGFVASGGLERAAEQEAREAAHLARKTASSGHVETEFQRILAEERKHGDAWERLSQIVGRLTARPERPF